LPLHGGKWYRHKASLQTAKRASARAQVQRVQRDVGQAWNRQDGKQKGERMSETEAEIRVFDKACDFVEECINNGQCFDSMIRAIKRAWVYVHDEKASDARRIVQRTIQP
jgi:hypothetical protein